MKQKLCSLNSFRFIKNCLFLFLITSLLSQPLTALPVDKGTGQPGGDTLKQKINLFGSDDLMEVSISFDLAAFQKKSDRAGSYDGTMTFNHGKADSISRKVTVKYRGEYRYRTCSFPPIQINFKKPVYAVSDTGKIKKIKVVTHCMAGSSSDDYVIREYLVYKLYSVFTDTSFRVRLLKVTYYDTGKKRKPVTQYAFFIEPGNILAARTNSNVIESTNLNQSHMIPAIMDRVAIFNYMIANWDWSVPGLHNIAVIKPKIIASGGLGIAVPYDFDLCGVVNADYGTPAPEMGLTSSRDRKFAGICRERSTIEAELKYFLEKKEKLYSVVNDFPLLSPRSKKDITSFLDQFFDQLEKQRDTEYLISNFLGSCKKL